MKEVIKKKEGFQGQKAVVLPRPILHNNCAKNEVVSTLYLTDIGYYPKAKFHYRERQHGADQHILIYCHDGSGRVKIDKTEYKIEPGDFFTIPIKTKHVYAADENNPWTIYWVHFKGSISGHIVSQFNRQNGYKGFIQSGKRTIELFNEIYSRLERGYTRDTLIAANMCLWHFLGSLLFNDQSFMPENTDTRNSIDAAINFLGKNTDKILTLEEIAKEVNLSPSHFSSIFKKKTGFSLIEYFNHLKVQKACQYLLFTNLRIKEISQELGIEDQYYFSRMFTKVMGVAPNDYREKRIH